MNTMEMLAANRSPRVVNDDPRRWSADAGVWNLMDWLFGHLAGKTDHNRKA